MKKLIINADDFGMSPVFNGKILELLEKGFIRSTTVMVNRITAPMKVHVDRLKAVAGIGIGLHMDFDFTKSLHKQMKEQYEKFMELFFFPPSHIDIHIPRQFSDKAGGAEVLQKLYSFAEKNNLPVRNHGIPSKSKQTTYPAYHNSSYSLVESEITAFLEKINEGESGEIITHPGDFDPDSKSSLNKQRLDDFNMIIQIQPIINRMGISCISYLEL